MKQTNFQLFDFLDFDTALTGEDVLWKTCAPIDVQVDGTDVIFEIPFQKQKVANDITPDREEPRKNYNLRLRAYGSKILRTSVGFGVPAMTESLMLELDPTLQVVPLRVEKSEEEWLVKDVNGLLRARLDRRPLKLDHWSDLFPNRKNRLNCRFILTGKRSLN